MIDRMSLSLAQADPEIAAAIEQSAPKEKFLGPELSFATLVARTSTMKSILLGGLD